MLGLRVYIDQPNNTRVELEDFSNYLQITGVMHWSLQYIDGVIKQNSKTNLFEIENTVNKSKKGTVGPWDSILDVSRSFDQIYELLIIGSKSRDKLQRFATKEKRLLNCEVVLELFDCSFWEIYVQKKEVLEEMANAFPNSKRI